MKIETLQQLLEALLKADRISVDVYVKNMDKLVWYAKNHRFEPNSTFLEHCVANNFLDLLKVYKHLLHSDEYWCNLAAKYGHIEMLNWLHCEKGYPIGVLTYVNAAEGGYLEVLKWLYSVKCPCNEWAAIWAARNGNLEMIKWLHDYRAPFDYTVAAEAAIRGHLDVLQFLHNAGLTNQLSTNLCSFAAAGGQLETLKWLRSLNYSVDDATMSSAFTRGHKEVYEYLRGSTTPL